MGFFVAIYGVADPSAPYGTSREFSLGFIPGGLAGLLFDQRFGLDRQRARAHRRRRRAGDDAAHVRGRSAAAPRTRAGLADRRLALELLFVTVPYLLTATSYAMWWAGWSAPARFANPAVLVLAIPCAVAWSRIAESRFARGRGGRAGLHAFLSCVLVVTDGGRLAYNTRETTALWLGVGVEARAARRRAADLVPGPRRRVRHRHRRLGRRARAGLVVRTRARRRRRGSPIAGVC